ncbi:MAG: hypothetical protein AAFR17_07530 [Pseudomonadota bacterium]
MSAQGSAVGDNERTLSSICIAAAMLLGLALPSLSAAFFDYLYHFLFLVVVFSFCSLNANILEVAVRIDKNTWQALGWQMAGIPMLVTTACFLMNTDGLTTAVLVATTTAGSVFASPALAHLVGLDRSVSIRIMLLSTFLMPISLLFFGELNGVIPAGVPLFDYLRHVVYFLLLPMVIAVAYWQVSPTLVKGKADIAEQTMHWLATLALIGFCIGVMHKLHGAGETHASQIFHYIFLVGAMVVTVYFVTMMLFAHLGKRAALTVGMLAANRNVALSFALISELLPNHVLAFVAVAQFPIFLVPIVVRCFQFVTTMRLKRLEKTA